MTRTIKIICAAALVLPLVAFAADRTAWTGAYVFEEDGGETAGGSPIFVVHSLTIERDERNRLTARLYSQGFQTSRDIRADVTVEGAKLHLHFRETGADHVFPEYEAGDHLLTLERVEIKGETLILTRWGKFRPVLESNEEPGLIYFEPSATGTER